MDLDHERDPSRVELGEFYSQSPADVWRALTDSALLERWFLPSIGFDGAQVGTEFMLLIPADSGAQIACEVVAVKPERSMTWSWTYMRDPGRARWSVDWEVEPQGRGTRLLITISGFDIEDKKQRMQRNATARGWRDIPSKLGKLLDELES